MQVNKQLHMVAWVLLIIGGLNWGLWGLLKIDLVNTLLGSYAPLDQIVYILVGISAVYEILIHKNLCKSCGM